MQTVVEMETEIEMQMVTVAGIEIKIGTKIKTRMKVKIPFTRMDLYKRFFKEIEAQLSIIFMNTIVLTQLLQTDLHLLRLS